MENTPWNHPLSGVACCPGHGATRASHAPQNPAPERDRPRRHVLALSATDSQIGLMRSTSGIANRVTWRGGGPHRADSVAYLRIVQSFQGTATDESLSAEQLQTVYEARSLRRVIAGGVTRSLVEVGDAKEARRSLYVLRKQARVEVEYLLGATFTDPGLVSRLMTEVTRHARQARRSGLSRSPRV